MVLPFRYRLSDREKDALLTEQAALIERQVARIAELEALLARPEKTSRNSHTPPSQDRKPSGEAEKKKRRTPRPSRPGVARHLTEVPDETIKRLATACPRCAAEVSSQRQTCRHRYDYLDIPPIAPVVRRMELFGGRCGACGRRFRAAAPEGMMPGTPFGARVRSLLLYLHHSHYIGFARLSRMMAELFGLKISAGAIVNAFRRSRGAMMAALRGNQDQAARRPGDRLGRDHHAHQWHHPLAVGVRLGNGGAAPDCAAPGESGGRRGARRSETGHLGLRSLCRPAGVGLSTSGLPCPCPA